MAVTVFYLLAASAFAQTCGTPGRDGSPTVTGTVNTYFPPNASVTAGSTSITLGASSGAATAIAAGDLVLIMQMQNATINSSDTSAYGSGLGTGSGSTSTTAGQYEFGVAISAVPTAGGTLTLATPLINSYYEAAATAAQGQETYQVLRVPQYASPTLGTVTALGWTGTVGGVASIDVDSALALGGGSINVTSPWTAASPNASSGFRGGGALDMSGDAPGDLNLNTEYRISALAFSGNNAGNTAPGFGDGGSKGEGIAGTPMYVANSYTTYLQTSTTLDGYPNGSFDMGAPGNAGGGGTEGDPPANDDNTGGGGGGNGGAGGSGGWAWNTAVEAGGVGGAAFPASATQVIMGGGGGSNSENNEYTNDCNVDPPGVVQPCVQANGNGAPGGGIVIVRSGTVTGAGTVNVSGSTAYQTIENDGGGGGGAGGSIIFTALPGNNLPGGLALTATGGGGGNAWYNEAAGANVGVVNGGTTHYQNEHGPGGGGGGGVIFTSPGTATSSVAGGANGYTTTGDYAYGSTPGAAGLHNATTTSASLPGASSGAQCLAKEITISGYVYDDANHNGSWNSSKTWPVGSPTVYVNLVHNGVVSQSKTITAGTSGAYSFTNVIAGVYTIVVTNVSATAITATVPGGWVAVSPTIPTISVLTNIGSSLYNQNFGFFNGTSISGEVFNDDGAGGGAGNDGILNGTEPGLANVTVTAYGSGSVLLGQVTTTQSGQYTLWLPFSAVNPVTITISPVGGFTATGYSDTGAALGGPSYSTTTLVLSFTATFTTTYTGVNFGFVQSGNSFQPNGQQTTVPGAVVTYAHVYTSITGGTVTFTETPSQPNYFTESLYIDTGCTGILSSTDTSIAWGAAQTMPAIVSGATTTKLCVLMKEQVSSSAIFGTQDTATITATFSYASIPALKVTDITTVDTKASGDLQLVKSSYIDTTCANPASPAYLTTVQPAQSGNCVKYQIQATNGGASTLPNGFIIYDTAPPYTTLQTASPAASAAATGCTGLTAPVLGTGITAIAATGAVQATFTGTMPAGCVAAFVYEIKLN